MNIFLPIFLASCIITMFIGFLIYYRDPANKLNKVFFGFSIVISYFSFIQFMITYEENLLKAEFWALFLSPWPISLYLLSYLAFIYSGFIKKINSLIFHVLFGGPVVYNLITILGGYQKHYLLMSKYGWFTNTEKNIFSLILMMWIIFITSSILAISIKHYISTKEYYQKKQALYFFSGLLVQFFFGYFTRKFIPSLGVVMPDITTLGFLATSFLIAYGIWKYGLLSVTPERIATNILNNMNDSLFVTNIDYKIIMLNKSASQLTGKENNSLLDSAITDFLPDFSNLISFKEAKAQETLLVKSDNSSIPVALSISEIFNQFKKTSAFLLIVRDLTEQKANEEKLAVLNKERMRSAHQAGQAEIATSVLHNVGNILTSVVISAELIQNIIEKKTAGKLRKANKIIEDNKDNIKEFISSTKGFQLIDYYSKLANLLEEEQKEIEKNSDRLIEKISAIKDVVVAQQSYASSASFNENLDLREVLEDALTIHTNSTTNYNIEIVKYFEDIPMLSLPKTKLLHVLVNLYLNARESMSNARTEKMKISITIKNNKNSVLLSFSDNGGGIDKKDIEKIFSYGFTTKKDGHGFGLHSSANYISEMGGNMWVESKGKGKGASFLVRFPTNS